MNLSQMFISYLSVFSNRNLNSTTENTIAFPALQGEDHLAIQPFVKQPAVTNATSVNIQANHVTDVAPEEQDMPPEVCQLLARLIEVLNSLPARDIVAMDRETLARVTNFSVSPWVCSFLSDLMHDIAANTPPTTDATANAPAWVCDFLSRLMEAIIASRAPGDNGATTPLPPSMCQVLSKLIETLTANSQVTPTPAAASSTSLPTVNPEITWPVQTYSLDATPTSAVTWGYNATTSLRGAKPQTQEPAPLQSNDLKPTLAP